MTSQRPLSSSLAGVVVSIVGIVVLSALIGGALGINHLLGKVDSLTTRLEKVSDRQKQAEKDAQAAEQARIKRTAAVTHQNDMIRLELRRSQRYVLRLTRVIVAAGIPVPADVPAPHPTPPRVTSHPKAPAPTRHPHHNPGSPAPTEPSPTSPSMPTPSACDLLPTLCPVLSLPTLLPKETR